MTMIRLHSTRALLLLLPVFLAAPPRAAWPRNHSELQWQTLTTEHFLIHFHQGTERTARRAAAIAEEIYPAITSLYDFRPQPPTHLIIRDTDDFANGAAYYYDDKIEIWATALEFELRGTHNWLRDVITHEFTHIVSLQAAARMPHSMPAFYLQGFGYEDERRADVLIGYPNRIYSYPVAGTIASAWFAEGVAQYQTRSVYNDWWDTHRDMLLRAATLDDALLTFDAMGGFGGTGLESELTYNQGNSLVRYIAEHYGEEAVAEIARGLRSIFLLDMDRAFKGATGKSGQELYDEWKSDLVRRYGEVKAEIAPQAIEGSTVSDSGYLNLFPAWRPGTSTLYWASNRGEDFGSLTAVELKEAPNAATLASNRQSVPAPKPVMSSVNTPLSFSDNGRHLYYSKRTDDNRYGYRVNDIYVYDLEEEEEKRLTNGLRAKDPAISPNGSQIAAVLNGDATNEVVLLDREGKLVRQLTKSALGTQYYTPRWSPDGRALLLGTYHGVSRDIVLLDIETGTEQLVADSPADDREPCFIPGEKAILFASDRTGIYNIYRQDLGPAGELTRVTNVVGGAFHPAVSADGQSLAFSAYTGRGYVIRVLPRNAWGNDPATGLDAAQAAAGGPIATEPIASEAAASDAGGTGAPASASLNHRGDYRLASAGPTSLRLDGDNQSFEGEPSRYKLSYPVTHLMPRVIIDDGRPRFGLYASSNEVLDHHSIFAGGAVGYRLNGFEFELFGIYENRKFPFTIVLEGYRVRRRAEELQVFRIPPGLGLPHSGQVRPVHFELRYDVTELDGGVRYEFGEPYSLTHWKNLSFQYAHQDYNINLFLTDNRDGSGYGKGGFSYYRGDIVTARFDYRSIERAIDSDINPRGGRTLEVRAAYNWAGLNPSGLVDNETFDPIYAENNFTEIEGDWREHCALPWGRHTLELRARGGLIDQVEVDDFFHFAVGSKPGLRGYSYFSEQGRKLGIGSVTYRFPIFGRVNQQFLQFLVHRLYGAVFYEAGNVWNDEGLEGLSADRLLKDTGFELRLDTTSFSVFPASFYLEGAYAIDALPQPGGKEYWRFYSGLLFGF
jgi:Tol biopolymer transport system component